MTQYSTREEWLNAFKDKAAVHFKEAGYPLPDNVRVSVGFTSKGARGNRIGECWDATASEDNHFEIFLKPDAENDARLADILTHELVHAAVGLEAGHGPAFRKCATALGLEGKMTATVAGDAWYAWAMPVLKELGPMPYGKLEGGSSSSPPKQKTNLLRVECSECGWLARVTRKHIEPHGALDCPVNGCEGHLIAEGL